MLDDLDLTGFHRRNDSHMPVGVTSMPVEDHEVTYLRFMLAGVLELQQVAAFIKGAVFYRAIKKIFGIAIRIGHFMVIVFIIIALYKLHALVSDADIVTIFRSVAFSGVAYAAIIIYFHTIKAVERLADFIPGIGIDFPQ